MRPIGKIRLSLEESIVEVRRAALDSNLVVGLTHQYYKYPARFSPAFVSAAIEAFSQPGALVLDPYMGGGTTIVEALASRRRAVGCDINSLAVFVAKTKIAALTRNEVDLLEAWALVTVPSLFYHDSVPGLSGVTCPLRTRNLQLPRARALKKYLSLALASCQQLTTAKARQFARCALLNVAQWALNGRKQTPSLQEFRERLAGKTLEMLGASVDFTAKIRSTSAHEQAAILIHASSEQLPEKPPFKYGELADLVVTSPPYPGVHVLYHRWQVDGRRETPAPYWIADCLDGKGNAFYNFGDRRCQNQDDYFETALRTLRGIRRVMRQGAMIVQMLAFSNPSKQLPRYLETLKNAGFREMRVPSKQHRRIWRAVPRRSWYAEQKGDINSAREVVLLHRAV